MHFPFTTNQVLWTITFAAQLVLLVVLLGRDRIKNYPWFTASIVLVALRLLAEMLLTGRMPVFTLQAIFIPLGDITALVGLLVLAELARKAFGGVQRSLWIVNTVGLVTVACVILAVWGPWPARNEIVLNSQLGVLRLLSLMAQKADLLVDLLTVELGILIVALGRKFKAGWRSHTQQIMIGLSTTAIMWLAVQGAWQMIAKSVHPTSRAEYEHVLALGTKLINANKVVYIAALLWWIVCLWIDEPGTPAEPETQTKVFIEEPNDGI